MKRSTFINLISASGLLGVAYAITPSGWDAEPRTRLISALLICPTLILSLVLFVLVNIDYAAWNFISLLTNIMLGCIALAWLTGALL